MATHRICAVIGLMLLAGAACGSGAISRPDSTVRSAIPLENSQPQVSDSALPQAASVTPDPNTGAVASVATPNQEDNPPVESDLPDNDDSPGIPLVDTSIHSVPLNEVVFDTFNGGFARLSEADGDLIEDLRDAITPIYDPVYGDSDGLEWLQASDLVIGYESEDGTYAYPIKVLDRHELVNDVIDGTPILVSWCPLCGSGVVYSRELDGVSYVFGNTSALYESDLVMYDHQTGSYWFQVLGEAIVGGLTGKRLALLPSVTITWGEWVAAYPDTRLLTRQGPGTAPFSYRRYSRDSSIGYEEYLEDGNFAFPVSTEKLDDRLRVSDIVLVAEVEDAVKAYPLRALNGGAVNDELGGKPVAVFQRGDTGSASVFFATLDGDVLNFRAEAGYFLDDKTGSLWDSFGRAVEGPLEGSKLNLVPTRRAYWFSVSVAMPGVDLYAPAGASSLDARSK